MAKQTIQCENCGHDNPVFTLKCESCQFHIRDRVVNLELFGTIRELIESPTEAFTKIIQAEHKNFIFFLSMLIPASFILNAFFIVFFTGNLPVLPLWAFAASIPAFLLTVLIYSLLLWLGMKYFSSSKVRVKDQFAVLIWAMLPMVFSLLFLFPLEFAVFGVELFTSNPSPFVIKPVLSWMFVGLESLLLLWGIFLGTVGLYCSTGNALVSLFYSVALYGTCYVAAAAGQLLLNLI